MLIKTIKTTCPLDCWDQCAMLVEVEKGRLLSISPDPEQKITGKYLCRKGRQNLARLNHPDRLRYPLLKKNGSFKRIGWNEALQAMACHLSDALARFGPLSLLHYHDGGYGGLLKNLESRFFSALGGCTEHRGSLCWAAGLAAQRYDFGEVYSHPHEDLANARLIIIWGRNPAHTQPHLLPFIRQAQKKGARVILIDPLRTATAALADEYIRVKPGSDGALALGMAAMIIEKGLLDRDFIATASSGFERYRTMAAAFSLNKTASLTGLAPEVIENLAVDYATAKPAALVIGIGLQRHSNGGNTVRAVDALAALTGNIGVRGGGASYANFQISRLVDDSFLNGEDLQPIRRRYPKPGLAKAISEFSDPPVDFLYISRANPLTQVGDSDGLRRAFKRVPFVVTAEHFMTDTANASDLVLPATAFLETEDLFYNSMSHQYLVYSAKCIEPPAECRPEYVYLRDLALLLDKEGFPAPEPDRLLARAIEPLTNKTGVTLEEIRENSPYLLPGGNDIPWAGRVFETADGRYNFYSPTAENDGVGGLPVYREPVELGDKKLRREGYCYWFVTPHHRDSIHSSHRLPDGEVTPKAYLHPRTAEQEGLKGGEKITVWSKRGCLQAVATVSDRVPPDAVVVYEGWWYESGAAVNKLTPARTTDMGCQAAFYDCLCRIEK
ncbi:MAG: hypothetical protein AVO34_09490 [Firmicutes bacterium ML8_F2]|nr:MAG: hypothetical protein AVO34_09490 [Firmicutes bacterium ML8_F2]